LVFEINDALPCVEEEYVVGSAWFIGGRNIMGGIEEGECIRRGIEEGIGRGIERGIGGGITR
jgi:hypothetical protein